ncbi:Rrf2 family transcriptional regulator [Mycoplasmopsis sturni]|uniref:Rrf2 family transcriptional regulator n=1 Tax=Mycoplasmopsis sturni TaxID=39047 RepID=UPI0005670A0E|nr:Rrf2 family transcriptional regulator [Mycoplasmopsis sturni]
MKNITDKYFSYSDFVIAIHSLVLLEHKKESLKSKYIAENIGVHETKIRNVLSRLVENNYVKRTFGRNGGYEIKNASVNLAELFENLNIKWIQHDYKVGNENSSCVVSCSMNSVMVSLMSDANEEVLNWFKKFTISELEQQIRRK